MFVRKLMVQPSEPIVTVTKLGAGTKKVESSRWQIQDRVASGGWPEARARGFASRRNLAGGELARESGEHIAGSQAYRNTVGSQHSASFRHPGRGWLRSYTGEAEDEVLLLVTGKNKRFVLDDGAARRESVVFVTLSWRLGTRGRSKEGGGRSEVLIPVVVIEGHVQIV